MGSLKEKCQDECIAIANRLDERANEYECMQDLPFLIKETEASLGHWAMVKESGAGGDPYTLFQYTKFLLIVKMYHRLRDNQHKQYEVFRETATQFDALARKLGF